MVVALLWLALTVSLSCHFVACTLHVCLPLPESLIHAHPFSPPQPPIQPDNALPPQSTYGLQFQGRTLNRGRVYASAPRSTRVLFAAESSNKAEGGAEADKPPPPPPSPPPPPEKVAVVGSLPTLTAAEAAKAALQAEREEAAALERLTSSAPKPKPKPPAPKPPAEAPAEAKAPAEAAPAPEPVKAKAPEVALAPRLVEAKAPEPDSPPEEGTIGLKIDAEVCLPCSLR